MELFVTMKGHRRVGGVRNIKGTHTHRLQKEVKHHL